MDRCHKGVFQDLDLCYRTLLCDIQLLGIKKFIKFSHWYFLLTTETELTKYGEKTKRFVEYILENYVIDASGNLCTHYKYKSLKPKSEKKIIEKIENILEANAWCVTPSVRPRVWLALADRVKKSGGSEEDAKQLSTFANCF